MAVPDGPSGVLPFLAKGVGRDLAGYPGSAASARRLDGDTVAGQRRHRTGFPRLAFEDGIERQFKRLQIAFAHVLTCQGNEHSHCSLQAWRVWHSPRSLSIAWAP